MTDASQNPTCGKSTWPKPVPAKEARMRSSFKSILFVLTCGVSVTWTAPAQERKADSALKPLVTLYGRQSMVTKPRIVRITSDREWQALWREHQLGQLKEATGEYEKIEFDFNRLMVIAVFQGEGILCGGYDVDSITESKDRLKVRVRCLYYQLAGLPGDEK